MINQEPDQEQLVDAWTGMPVDLDSVEAQPYVVPVRPKAAHLDLGGALWRYLASGSKKTPAEILHYLAQDPSPRIRRRCASNPNSVGDTLALLAEDSDETIRAAVARNPHTPLYVLRQLSQDSSVEVRFAIASNAEMPDAILLSLFMDPDPFVAERASQTLST